MLTLAFLGGLNYSSIAASSHHTEQASQQQAADGSELSSFTLKKGAKKRLINKIVEEPKTDPQAILSFIFGVCSIFGALLFVGAIFSLFGILLSLKTLSNIRKEPNKRKGKGWAMAALVLSIIGLFFQVAVIFFIAGLF